MIFESNKIKIGKKVKEYRKRMHFTQFELAEKIGLNEKQISRIESGQNYPTYLTFIKLIDVLDINLLDDLTLKTPVQSNPLQDEIISIIRNSDSSKQKIYLAVLKALEKAIE